MTIDPGSKAPLGVPRSRAGLFRRFRKDQRGVTAVEFGFVAFPFLFMLMMIVETALVFWTRQVVQEATNQAARTILTGQSQSLYSGTPAQQTTAFRNTVCGLMRMTNTTDCMNRLFVDVQPAANFPANVASMVQNGQIDPASFSMRQPGPSQITIVRAVYTMPVIAAGFFGTMARLNNGRNAIDVTVAFRTEPFPT
jgi:Flp pilus assembly protein TadG